MIKYSSKSTSITLCCLLACVIGLLSYRSLIGVDFGDESFHIATAYHLDLGARPFIDETSVRHMFAFFTLPILKVMRFLGESGNEYLVLKMRLAFVVVLSLFFILLYLTIRSQALTSDFRAGVSCLVAMLYIPTNLFSLHYANLGFMFLGSSLCLNALYRKRKKVFFNFAAGVSLGMATIAHPGVFLAAVFVFFRSPRRNGLLFLGMTSTWCFFMWAFDFSITDYFSAILRTQETVGREGNSLDLSRIKSTLIDIVPKGPLSFLVVAWPILFGLSFKGNKKTAFILILCLPLIIFFNSRASRGGPGAHGYLLSLAYLSPILSFIIYGRAKAVSYFLNFWMPCFLAFILCSFLSSGGVAGTSGAFMTVLPFSLVFLLEGLSQALTHEIKRVGESIVFIPLLLFGLFFFRNLFSGVYQEDVLNENLSFTVASGPFQGLQTTQAKKAFIQNLQKDLTQLAVHPGRIVFSCFFPAGYLLTGYFPNHDFLWGAPSLDQIKSNTDIVVRLKEKTYSQLNVWSQNCPPLPETIAGNKGAIIQKEKYEIWVKNEVIQQHAKTKP